MLTNLALGTLIIGLNVVLHTLGLIVLTRWISAIMRWLRLHRHDFGRTVAMVATVLGLFTIHTFEIWAWAFTYMAIGAQTGIADALYFSTTTFSTVGYGDLVLPPRWRLLGALEGVNGFLLIGWSTAYLVASSTRNGPFRTGEHF